MKNSLKNLFLKKSKGNEGNCPTHVVVIYKNRFFQVNAYAEDRETLYNINELYEQLKYITNMAKHDGVGIGALTADYRDDWANVRLMKAKNQKKSQYKLI